jgi:hypothetical protein
LPKNLLLKPKLFLITPPFTQLNTPYPATAYIKGFLNTLEVPSEQADLGIEVILKRRTEPPSPRTSASELAKQRGN